MKNKQKKSRTCREFVIKRNCSRLGEQLLLRRLYNFSGLDCIGLLGALSGSLWLTEIRDGIADGYTEAGADELKEICIERMVMSCNQNIKNIV